MRHAAEREREAGEKVSAVISVHLDDFDMQLCKVQGALAAKLPGQREGVSEVHTWANVKNPVNER